MKKLFIKTIKIGPQEDIYLKEIFHNNKLVKSTLQLLNKKFYISCIEYSLHKPDTQKSVMECLNITNIKKLRRYVFKDLSSAFLKNILESFPFSQIELLFTDYFPSVKIQNNVLVFPFYYENFYQNVKFFFGENRDVCYFSINNRIIFKEKVNKIHLMEKFITKSLLFAQQIFVNEKKLHNKTEYKIFFQKLLTTWLESSVKDIPFTINVDYQKKSLQNKEIFKQPLFSFNFPDIDYSFSYEPEKNINQGDTYQHFIHCFSEHSKHISALYDKQIISSLMTNQYSNKRTVRL